MRPITITTGQYGDLSFEEVCRTMSEIGYDGLEIAVASHLDVRRFCAEEDYRRQIQETLDAIQNNKEAFLASHIYQNAVAMCILQLGELTKQLTPEFTAAHRQIPWSLIAKTRDNYAHHYGVVDFELVWETAVEDIPGLAAFCSSYLNQ